MVEPGLATLTALGNAIRAVRRGAVSRRRAGRCAPTPSCMPASTFRTTRSATAGSSRCSCASRPSASARAFASTRRSNGSNRHRSRAWSCGAPRMRRRPAPRAPRPAKVRNPGPTPSRWCRTPHPRNSTRSSSVRRSARCRCCDRSACACHCRRSTATRSPRRSGARTIRRFGPRSALMDERYKVAISRIGNAHPRRRQCRTRRLADRTPSRRAGDAAQGAERLVSGYRADVAGADLERRPSDAAGRSAGARRKRIAGHLAEPRPWIERLGAGLRIGARRCRRDGRKAVADRHRRTRTGTIAWLSERGLCHRAVSIPDGAHGAGRNDWLREGARQAPPSAAPRARPQRGARASARRSRAPSRCSRSRAQPSAARRPCKGPAPRPSSRPGTSG